MKAAHRTYDHARRQLLDARAALPGRFVQEPGEELPPEVVAVKDAERALRAAEVAVADELQAAWDRNQRAVVDAKAAITTARREQARIETECGTAARARDRRTPVLNEAEQAAVTAARAAVQAAVEAHTEAGERFKAGVTAEQLADADHSPAAGRKAG